MHPTIHYSSGPEEHTASTQRQMFLLHSYLNMHTERDRLYTETVVPKLF